MRQFMGDMVDEETPLEKNLKKLPHPEENTEGVSFIPDRTTSPSKAVIKAKADSPFAPGSDHPKKDFNQPLSEKEEVNSVGAEIAGNREGDKNLLEFKNSELIRELRHKGDKNFGFSFFKDDFIYRSTSNFDRTFRGDDSNQIRASENGKSIVSLPLMVRLAGHELVLRSRWMRFGLGAGIGVGYNGGRGYFSDGSRSDANINLWTIPVDASFLLEIPMAYIKLSGFGGPSVLGLIQNRSDLQDGNARKNLRQASFGYFAGAKLGISISELFPGISYDYFGSYQVTRYYLNFEIRHQNYENFKTPELSVSGESYGVGFTFEYF